MRIIDHTLSEDARRTGSDHGIDLSIYPIDADDGNGKWSPDHQHRIIAWQYAGEWFFSMSNCIEAEYIDVMTAGLRIARNLTVAIDRDPDNYAKTVKLWDDMWSMWGKPY